MQTSFFDFGAPGIDAGFSGLIRRDLGGGNGHGGDLLLWRKAAQAMLGWQQC